MSDLIDRQAAIDTLDKHLRTTDVPVSYPGIISALTEWLNELPSAQADSKETSSTHKALDTVSRQAVIEAINKIFPADPMHDDYTQGITCGAALANIYVGQLPSAQPDLSEYSDKLWQKAYERGKVEAQDEIVCCEDCKNRGDDDCPMRFIEWVEYDDDGYIEYDDIIHDYTKDDGFCDRAERRTDEQDSE